MAAAIVPSSWELQSTGAQLLSYARLQKQLRPDDIERIDRLTRQVISIAFRGEFNIAATGFEGKLGLALSGGGFRASLFHIGVLARLAELDLLRHVEVISCVSGGSIIGAHYYLLLRELLQRKPDSSILRSDYVEVVDKLLEQFLRGVQKNLRMRVAASWIGNFRMIFQPGMYSRTQRLGHLYEKYLYAQIDDGEQHWPRWLNEAFIVPKKDADNFEDGFSPKLDNWRRAAKVPMLILNCTTLNTGRNWQFTASWLGEPLSYGTGIDSTERLDAVYYSEAPGPLREYRLGHAVAASSCVPALFTPISITGLFPDRTVRLVDGGVHDNQGTRALLDQDCDAVIVSDASGQMRSQHNPSHGEFGVLLRTNSALQARIRVAQHQELQARQRASLLRKCGFLHLMKKMESVPVHAIGASIASELQSELAPAPSTLTEYGVDHRIQLALAGLRTDLDSFTDREALALMYSGYVMAAKYLNDFAVTGSGAARQWRFLNVRDAMVGRNQQGLSFDGLLRHLNAGSKLTFKVWYLHPLLSAIGILIIVVGSAAGLCGLWYLGQADARLSLNVSSYAQTLFYFLVGALVVAFFPMAKRFIKVTRQAMHPSTVVAQWVFAICMVTVGFLVCRMHLWFFDRIFLRLGRVKR